MAIKAKSGRGDEVEKALRAVCDGLVENSIWTVTYLPKLSAAQVVRKDDYVAFIMPGGRRREPDDLCRGGAGPFCQGTGADRGRCIL